MTTDAMNPPEQPTPTKRKKPSKESPTKRSLKLMRDEGYLVAITERWNPFAHIRQDLFGFIDLLCVRGNEIVAVQTTSGDNVAARIDKINALQAADLWLESPTRRIEVHGWARRGAAGKRKLWTCRRVAVTAETKGQP